jgi:hypothetical protein
MPHVIWLLSDRYLYSGTRDTLKYVIVKTELYSRHSQFIQESFRAASMTAFDKRLPARASADPQLASLNSVYYSIKIHSESADSQILSRFRKAKSCVRCFREYP